MCAESYDLATGQQLRSYVWPGGEISRIWVGHVRGRPCLAAAFIDGLVSVRDLDTDETAGIPFRIDAPADEYRGWTRSLTVAEVDGTAMVLVGGRDGRVLVHDLDTGRPLSDPLDGHHWEMQVVGVATIDIDGTPAAVSAADDRRLVVWDLSTCEQLSSVRPVELDDLTGSRGFPGIGWLGSVAAVSLPAARRPWSAGSTARCGSSTWAAANCYTTSDATGKAVGRPPSSTSTGGRCSASPAPGGSSRRGTCSPAVAGACR
jgi:WD40 repeat protein